MKAVLVLPGADDACPAKLGCCLLDECRDVIALPIAVVLDQKKLVERLGKAS